MVAPNTGELVDALEAGRIDVSFMPVDEERKKRIDFGPVYFQVESTYMVTAASGIKTVAEVDRAGVRVVGIANTTTIRAAGRTLKNTDGHRGASIGDAIEMMTRRQGRRLRAVAQLAAAVRGASCPARASSRAAFSSPASPSRCRRAGRRRWLLSRRSWRRRRRSGAVRRAFDARRACRIWTWRRKPRRIRHEPGSTRQSMPCRDKARIDSGSRRLDGRARQ